MLLDLCCSQQGSEVDVRYPYVVVAICNAIGAAVTLFLPETLGQRLPGSLEEAKVFGKDQPFWGLPKSNLHVGTSKKNDEDSGEKEKLNVSTYAP